MAWVRQPVLPLLPASAVVIGPVAGLIEDADGAGEVYVNGLLTFAFTAADYVGRRLAAVTLLRTKVASAVAIAAGFGVSTATVFRWRAAYEADGVAGLFEDKAGPKSGPRKLTPELIEQVGRLRDAGETLQAIATATNVSTDTVRRALRARSGEDKPAVSSDAQELAERPGSVGSPAGDAERAQQAGPQPEPDATPVLPVLAGPTPRTAERRAARSGQLAEAAVRFTPGARLPLAGLWLALATPSAAHLLDAFTATYARLRNGFYGMTAVVLTGLFLALVREPRAEGLTRLPPADLGRLLGLDRAPEVSTFRRKLTELERSARPASWARRWPGRTPPPARTCSAGATSTGTPAPTPAPGPCRRPASLGCTWPGTPPGRPGSATCTRTLCWSSPRCPPSHSPPSWCARSRTCGRWSGRAGAPPSSSTGVDGPRPPSPRSSTPVSTW